MGFNYLQTDDRDDYLYQFGNRKPKKQALYDLISPTKEIIFSSVQSYKLKQYCKKKYIPFGKGAKQIWRSILVQRGYLIIKI